MSVPAGWYDDGSGRLRWWDGAQWTEHFAPAAPAASEAPAAEEIDVDATVIREQVDPAPAEASDPAGPVAPEPAPASESAPAEPETPAAPQAPEPEVAAEPAPPAPPAPPSYPAPSEPAPSEPAPQQVQQYPPYVAPAGGYPGAPQQQPPQPYGAAQPTPPYGAAPSAPPYGAAYGGETPAAPKKAPIIGFIALGVAVVGTILACIPPFVWFIGFFLLFVAFVLGIVGLFIKDTAKWPAITGLALSVVGAAIGAIVGTIILVASVASTIDSSPTTEPDISSEAPSDEPSEQPVASRPSADEITEGFLIVMEANGISDYDDPAIAGCIGQYMYDSDLSDETLTTIAGGEDIYSPVEEAQHVSEVTRDAIVECAG